MAGWVAQQPEYEHPKNRKMNYHEEDEVVQALDSSLTQLDGDKAEHTLIFCLEALWQARWYLRFEFLVLMR